MADNSDQPNVTVEVAKEAANYTLAMNVSQVEGDFYGKEKQKYMRLTIRLPSPDFATRMIKRMEEKLFSDADEDIVTRKALLSGKSLASDKREVSIILPLSVKKVEADSRGIIVVFDRKKEDEAERWNGYSGIWDSRALKYELRIYYNWSHDDLAKVVDPPTPKKDEPPKKNDPPKKKVVINPPKKS